MDLFNEIDDLSDLFLLEKNTKLDSAIEGYEDLQSRYSSLHEDYAKEIENSKKVEKCLVKCLKFYSKLSKKYETQQKLISSLEQTIKEKIVSLEEAQRNEEKLRGLIQVYRTERAFYTGQSNSDLRKDKEILLDICCRLIGESVRNNNIRSLTNLLLRKFKKDLDDEKLNLLKKTLKLKNEFGWDASGDVKSSLFTLKSEEVKTEKKYSEDLGEGCLTKDEDEPEPRNSPLDLTVCRSGGANQPVEEAPEENSQIPEMSDDESEYESSLPELEEVFPEPAGTAPEKEMGGVVEQITEQRGETVGGAGNPNRESEKEDCVREVFEEGNTTMVESEGEGSFDSAERQPTGAVAIGFKSIFDISDGCLKASDSKSDSGVQEDGDLSEIKFGYSFEEKEQWGPPRLENVAGVELKSPVKEQKEEKEEKEEEVFKILREMSSMRLPALVGEIVDALEKAGGNAGNGSRAPPAKKEQSQKRNLAVEENCWKNKKSRGEGVGEEGGGQSGGLLDSIMSAMSLQNKEFKSEGSRETVSREGGSRFSSLGRRTYSRRKKSNSGSFKENSSETPQQSPGKKQQNRQPTLETLVMEEIKNFVSSPMPCKEEADKQVKQCVSVLQGKPEEMIAKCIVAIVLENVDEVVEVFERPAPPLTKTQHRLIVLLSVFRTIDSSFEKISTGILSMISEKLFPDNFFWPDDSVEAATRFYAALCRARNDPKILWRFCLQAMTEMRQRCPLLVFTVLKTWPDVLYDAATLKNNFLAVTIVNIFLHMPKTEGLRNGNQSRKLVALKHLLMNFYQFKIEDTIEGHAKKVLAALRREEPGTGKSVVLMCKCRDAGWTAKNVVPVLRSTLDEWAEGKVEDRVGRRVLCVAKEVCGVLLQEGAHEGKVKELVRCLAGILSSGKKSHDSEVDLIEVLLQLKQYPEARKIIREWIPKSPIEDCLRNEIINASAENILRELKLNKKKEANSPFSGRKMKKQTKKLKGSKKKGKNWKSERRKAGSVGVSS